MIDIMKNIDISREKLEKLGQEKRTRKPIRGKKKVTTECKRKHKNQKKRTI